MRPLRRRKVAVAATSPAKGVVDVAYVACEGVAFYIHVPLKSAQLAHYSILLSPILKLRNPDLVAHCGESTAGEYVYTLDATDIATGWTECEPVLNRGQAAVFGALERIRGRLPFPLLGIDSDNGSEFINAHLLRYCEDEKLTFTRCRPYHKNDQAHIEQKNYTHVRQLVGYDRYGGEEALEQLKRIYELARVWQNGYLPTMKLVSKEREGAKVRKRYDEPRTPYKRALLAGVVGEEARLEFERLLGTYGPMGLKQQLDAQIEKLWRLRVGAQSLIAAARYIKAEL